MEEDRELHNALEKLSFNWDRAAKGKKKGPPPLEKKKSEKKLSLKRKGTKSLFLDDGALAINELAGRIEPEAESPAAAPAIPSKAKPTVFAKGPVRRISPSTPATAAPSTLREAQSLSEDEIGERKLYLFSHACVDSLWKKDEIAEFKALLLTMKEEDLRIWQEMGIKDARSRSNYRMAECKFTRMMIHFGFEDGQAPCYMSLVDTITMSSDSKKALEFTIRGEEHNTDRFILSYSPQNGEVKKSSVASLEFGIVINNCQEINQILTVRVSNSFSYYLRLAINSLPSLYGTPAVKLPKTMDLGYFVPVVVMKLRLRLIDLKGIEQKGIFSIPVERRALMDAKLAVDSEDYVSLEDVHIVANLIKAFYRDIPDILGDIPFNEIEAVDDQMDAVDLTKKFLKAPEMSLLCWIIDLAADVVVEYEKNGMGAKSMANVLAPNLLSVSTADQMESLLGTQRSVDFVYFLICHSLFERYSERATKEALQADKRKMTMLKKEGALMTVEKMESMNWKQSDQVYDMVVCVDTIEDILPEKGGWKVKFLPSMEFLLKGEKDNRWTSSVISVLGLYNRGKTFMLNQIANLKLKSGTTIHTEGISFKVVQNKHARHILLDTAGLHAPVRFSDERTDEALALRSASEFFLQDLTFVLSDFFLVVINDLTSLDQEYILKLQKKLADFPQKVQQVYVAHNFISAKTKEELDSLWVDQVVSAYGKFGQEVNEYVMSRDIGGVLNEDEVCWINTPNSRHLSLANGNSQVGQVHNPAVISLLKQWLGTMFIPVNRSFSPMHLILKHANSMIYFYVINHGLLEFNQKLRKIVMKSEPGQPKPVMRPAIIDEKGFTFVDADFIPKSDMYADEQGLHILIDAPGLTDGYKVYRRGFDRMMIEGGREKPVAQMYGFQYGMRKYGKFKKEIKLPSGFNIFECKHWITEDGIIKIFIPKHTIFEEIPAAIESEWVSDYLD